LIYIIKVNCSHFGFEVLVLAALEFYWVLVE